MSKKEKIKGFVKKYRIVGVTVMVAAVSIAAGSYCIKAEQSKKALRGLGNLCTKACVTGEEITTTLVNDVLGKKVLIRISEVKG